VLKEKRIPSVVPIYSAAIAWLAYAMVFPLYRLWHFIVCAVFTVLVFLLMKRLFPGKVVKVKVPDPPAPTTGNPELDKMIADGKAAMEQMRKLNEAIENPVISGQINELERLSGRIFDAVKQEPKKLGEIRSFMNYYLPTTIRLLSGYDKLVRQGQAGENVEATKAKIENVMETIVTAYRKLLDSLFAADAIDITADIKVLETMMEKDGLTN